MLEPLAGKLAWAVLRGERGVSLLPTRRNTPYAVVLRGCETVQFKGFALELNGAAAFSRQRSPCTELRFAVHRCDTLRRRQAAAPLAIMMNIFFAKWAFAWLKLG